jgi:hypothetical protein
MRWQNNKEENCVHTSISRWHLSQNKLHLAAVGDSEEGEGFETCRVLFFAAEE